MKWEWGNNFNVFSFLFNSCQSLHNTINEMQSVDEKVSSPKLKWRKTICTAKTLTYHQFLSEITIKVVLGGYCRCPDSHDLSECHHLYDLSCNYHWTLDFQILLIIKFLVPPISLTVLTLTLKKISVTTPWDHLK